VASKSSRKVPVSPTGRGRFRDDMTPWRVWGVGPGGLSLGRSAPNDSTRPRSTPPVSHGTGSCRPYRAAYSPPNDPKTGCDRVGRDGSKRRESPCATYSNVNSACQVVTGWDGYPWTGGQGVVGSNPASPTNEHPSYPHHDDRWGRHFPEGLLRQGGLDRQCRLEMRIVASIRETRGAPTHL